MLYVCILTTCTNALEKSYIATEPARSTYYSYSYIIVIVATYILNL